MGDDIRVGRLQSVDLRYRRVAGRERFEAGKIAIDCFGGARTFEGKVDGRRTIQLHFR